MVLIKCRGGIFILSHRIVGYNIYEDYVDNSIAAVRCHRIMLLCDGGYSATLDHIFVTKEDAEEAIMKVETEILKAETLLR